MNTQTPPPADPLRVEVHTAPHGNDITLVVRARNHAPCYLVDCGAVDQLHIQDLKRIGAVFVSHTHFDHWTQFDTVFRHFIGTGNTLRVFGPPQIIEHVQARLRSYLWNLAGKNDFLVEVGEVNGSIVTRRARLRAPLWDYEEFYGPLEQTTIFESDVFAVYATTLDHGTPSIAYRFVTNDDVRFLADAAPERPGRWVGDLKRAFLAKDPERTIELNTGTVRAGTLYEFLEALPPYHLGIILDHAASAANHELIETDFRDYDRVYIESYFWLADRERAEQKHHSYSAASGAVLRRAGVQSAEPIHFSRLYGREEAETLRAEFFGAFHEKT